MNYMCMTICIYKFSLFTESKWNFGFSKCTIKNKNCKIMNSCPKYKGHIILKIIEKSSKKNFLIHFSQMIKQKFSYRKEVGDMNYTLLLNTFVYEYQQDKPYIFSLV